MLSILSIVLIAVVLAVSFYPFIKKVQKKTRMPLVAAIFLVLILPLLALVIFGVAFIPSIVREVPVLLSSLNSIISSSSIVPSFVKDFNFMSYLQTHLDYANTTVSIALVILSSVTTLVFVFFLIYDFERLRTLFLEMIPSREKARVVSLSEEVAVVIGQYIVGNFIISGICGTVIFLGLVLLHVPFALPLAVFAAIMDLLPLVGQTLGAVPTIIIAFGISPITGLLVILLHIIYQQVENAVISPVVYNKALNLIPSVSFLSVLVGASIFGMLGAFLALPVAASIPAIVSYVKRGH